VVNVAALMAAVLLCTYPFYYILIYSLSTPIEAYKGLTLVPKGITLENYRRIFGLDAVGSAFLVSTARTAVGTAVTVFCTSFFAYLMTRRDMPARRLIYRMTVITMYLSAGLIPWYLLIKFLGLRNTFLVYVLPGAVSAFEMILVKTYIESIPRSLEESAMVDGARLGHLFFSVILPLCKPILATIAVFTAVGNWNSYFDNYFFVSKKSLQTLQLLLFNYLREAQSMANMSTEELSRLSADQLQMTPDSVRMTITMVVTFPILFVYPFFQRYFVKGIMLGAVKG
jgi:ABC-type glycerol-3-phosphate transport system permease component